MEDPHPTDTVYHRLDRLDKYHSFGSSAAEEFSSDLMPLYTSLEMRMSASDISSLKSDRSEITL